MPPPHLHSPLLKAIPWIEHGFGTRAGAPPPHARQLRQIHSALVWRDPKQRAAGDGMYTGRRGRPLTIRTADCVPILIADTRIRAVAAVHAGWRGTLARVVEKTVGELRAHMGSDPAELRAAIGPSIRGCCYEVGEEVQQAFSARFAYADDLFSEPEDDPSRNRYPAVFMTGAPPGHPYDPRWNHRSPLRLDLARANLRQLLDAGLPEAAVDIMPECTVCHPEMFFSHRRGDSDRLFSFIAIR